MSQPLRIGLIGAGAIAQTYIPALAKSTTAKLVGVAYVRTEAAQALAERMHVPVFGDALALCEATQAEAMIVCTPPSTHPEICNQLLARGIHVLCEKPLAISPTEARSMLQAAEESSALLTMASKFR
jgi:predicted dehydrogenase